ncbi:MAG: transporter substrate-binding domain-containing protein [Pseudomonadota bacterium]
MHFIRFCAVALALSLSLPWGAAFAASHETLTVVADEWPPFSGERLPRKGVSIEVARAALERSGYQVETRILPWARIMDGARKGLFDVTTSLFADPDLAKFLNYGEPFMATSIRFVQRRGGTARVASLEELAAYDIAVGAGFLYEEEFDRAETLRKVEVTTTLQGLRMVASGRVDLTLDSEHVVNYGVRVEDPALEDQLEYLDPPLVQRFIHMAVSRQRPDHQKIVADFNAAMAEMREDGSLAAILRSHGIE